MGPLAFDGGLMVWTLVTFGCLFWLLSRYAFRPLKEILARREQQIRGSLEKAEKARQEAEDLLALNDQKLGEARDEARRVINEGHRIVSEMKREAEARVKEQADAIASQARAEIDRELQKGLDELKTTVAGLSMRIARQVIGAKLDENEHQRLADDFVERLKKVHAQHKP